MRRHLAAAAGRLPGLELRVISDSTPELSASSGAADLVASYRGRRTGRGDIGVSWLPDDSWSRGKCGLRVLQYMAAGLPVVANPVGMNRTLVLHGETGFLASTPQEWAEAIARLAADPHLRQRMGGWPATGRRSLQRGRLGSRLAAAVDAVAQNLFCQSSVHPTAWPVSATDSARAQRGILDR